MMNDFLRDMVKELEDENTHIMEDGLGSSEFSDWIDTGSYILNALLSGDIYGGVPNNKVIAFAGESATGKCVRGSELIEVYATEETLARLKLL